MNRQTLNSAPHAGPSHWWIGPLMIALAGSIVLAWSWGTWPDPITDAGRELYVPWRLTLGDRLYADIAYFNGPLSPYLNAGWFKLFGVSIRTLAIANLALLVILVALIYSVMRQVADDAAATASGLVFVLVFAFGQYSSDIDNYNYVLPYSHEASHGLILAFASLWLLARYVRAERIGWLIATGLSVGSAFLTKPEVFLAVALAVVGGLSAWLWVRRAGWRDALRVACVFLASATAPAVIAWTVLSCVMPAKVAAMGVLGGWPAILNGDVARLPFYRWGMGLLDIRYSLRWLAGSTLVYGGFVAGVWMTSVASARYRRVPRVATHLGAMLLVVGAGGFMASQFVDAGRALPVAALLIAIIAALKLAHRRDDLAQAPVRVMRLAAGILAMVLLLKIILNARTFHYGVFLAMPATLLVVAALVTWGPDWLGRRGHDREIARFAGIGFCVAAAVIHLAMSARQVVQKRHEIVAGHEVWRSDARAHYMNEAIQQIERRVARGQTLAVLPEGAMLNYLTRRSNPTPYISLMPPELLMFGERAIVEAYQSRPPDFICLVQRDTWEYGSRAFGRGYGQGLYRWVLATYRPVHAVGVSPLQKLDQTGMVLMERHDLRARDERVASPTP